jgi:two-component system, LytTR family, response regulator LytT
MDILIIEDEELSAKKLKNMALAIEPNARILATIESIEKSVEWLLANNSPSLIFMDIELSDGQSFEIFEKAEVNCPVIFTTAYDQYAIQAFKVNSIDYLLKPIRQDELSFAMEKYKKLQANQQPQPPYSQLYEQISSLSSAYKNRFLVKSGSRLVPVSTNEIAYFYSEQKVTSILTTEGRKYAISHSLEELEKILNPREFFRANRQFIISYGALENIHQYFKGKLKIELKPKPDISFDIYISKERASEFKDWLSQ